MFLRNYSLVAVLVGMHTRLQLTKALRQRLRLQREVCGEVEQVKVVLEKRRMRKQCRAHWSVLYLQYCCPHLVGSRSQRRSYFCPASGSSSTPELLEMTHNIVAAAGNSPPCGL